MNYNEDIVKKCEPLNELEYLYVCRKVMVTYGYCSQLQDAVFSVVESIVAAVAAVDCRVAGTSSVAAVEEYFFAYIFAVE